MIRITSVIAIKTIRFHENKNVHSGGNDQFMLKRP